MSNISTNNKNRWQQKFLSADVTTNGDMTDLEFTLEIGKTYRISYQARFTASVADTSVGIEVRDGATVLARPVWSSDFNGSVGTFGGSLIRTMADTSLSFVSISASADALIAGNGGGAETYAIVEELNNSSITTAW